MKHSPAPWKLIEGDDEGNVLVVMDEGHKVYIGDLEDTCSTCHANAYLIYTAPELLDVLEALVERIDLNGGLGEYKGGRAFVMSQARDVIAKAKGMKYES